METPNKSRFIVNSNQLIEFTKSTDLSNISEDTWNTIDWKRVTENVKTHRKRIFAKSKKFIESKSSLERSNNLKSLIQCQERMIFSYDNLLFSIRRVTQINQGKNTPGLDKFLIDSPGARMQIVSIIRDYVKLKDYTFLKRITNFDLLVFHQ